MYPNFHKAALAIASQDEKKLWNRWLTFRNGLKGDDLEHLFEVEVQPVFFGCALAMLIAPDPKALAECMGWVNVDIDCKIDHGELLDWKKVKWTQYQKSVIDCAEYLVLGLLHDLATRSTLNPNEMHAWMMCEEVISLLLLGNKTIDDPRTLKLMRHVRFYSTVTPDSDSTTAFVSMTSLTGAYEDERWCELMWSYMERLIDEEFRGRGPFRPKDQTPLDMQYVHALCVACDLGLNWFPDLVERIKFAADRGFLAAYHNQFTDYSALFLMEFVQDPQILFSIVLNFLCIKTGFEFCEFELEQLERVRSIVRRYGDDEVVTAFLLRKNTIAEHIRLAEESGRVRDDGRTPYGALIEEMKNPG